ncbi:unnamed protein product [Adineta ricciae]|uniref:BED-type domain-containing protein n=1 Tax=Adineta ricciae TaxID=249248 RepID=A0A816AH09_ADIRI|nr:unnamed protein product [Adineta ricciae]
MATNSKTRPNSLTSSNAFSSPRKSANDVDDLSLDSNSSNSSISLPSSITVTPRPTVKAKRSLVWRYFRTINEKSFDVECILCSTKVPRKSTSTSNMLHHVQTRHENEYQVVNKAMRSKAADAPQRLPLSSERSAHLTRLAANLIISTLLPLSLVENPQLQLIFQEAEPSYILPKRKYFIGNVLNQMYDETRNRVQNELNCAISVCLTTDIWTSQSNEAYMTVTVHFIDTSNSKLKSFVLETTEFSGNHTAQRIVERLENICIDWSILDKVVCLVSDTCNVMRKVGNDFAKGWFGCTDHLLNLCVNDVIRKRDDVKNVLSTVRHIVSFVRNSHLAYETLNKYQRSLGVNERHLIYDVSTRWNSTYYMLQRFIDEKLSISACLNEKAFQKNLSTAKISRNIDWDLQEQLMIVLEPFEAATRKLSVEFCPSISLVLPVITTLITSLENRTSDSLIIKQIKNTLRCSIEERFEKLFEDKNVLLATVLDPRWKNFSFLQSSSYQQHVDTHTCLTKMSAFDAKLLSYIYLHDEYVADLASHPKSYVWDGDQSTTYV